MSDEASEDLTDLSTEVTDSSSQSPADNVRDRSSLSSPSNVYTPLLHGARLLSVSSPVDITGSESKLDPEVPKDAQTKRGLTKSNSAVVTSRDRGQRSSVKPFFCCASELSLVSLVDTLDIKDGHGRSASNFKSIECSGSSSEEEESALDSSQSLKSQAISMSSGRLVVRRKKKDKLSAKKKFWSLRLRGRWNTRWRVSQPQRSGSHRADLSHHSGGSMSQGTFQSTSSPGLGRRASRARAGSSSSQVIDLSHIDFDRLYPTEDIHTIRIRERAEEMAQGVEVHRVIFNQTLRSNLGLSTSMLDILRQRARFENLNSESTRSSPGVPSEEDFSLIMNNFMHQLQSSRDGASEESKPESPRIYTQVDFIHCLVPQLVKIMKCPFYWGIMDRYEAERLLDNKPEGTFLLRDSAQEDFLFSVSFRRYNRSLHARVEQWNHRFSFDAHDPCVYSAPSVCELMEHYKDPSSCMFFEPMLTRPLPRNFTFTLQHLCRAAICDCLVYDQIHSLPIPNGLKQFLQAYHYKQKVRVRHFDGSGVVYADNQVMLN